jgi:hypothetical protein
MLVLNCGKRQGNEGNNCVKRMRSMKKGHKKHKEGVPSVTSVLDMPWIIIFRNLKDLPIEER